MAGNGWCVKSHYMKADSDSSCAMMVTYEDHPILVELHKQVDSLYDPVFDGTLYETLFLISSNLGASRVQGKI